MLGAESDRVRVSSISESFQLRMPQTSLSPLDPFEAAFDSRLTPFCYKGLIVGLSTKGVYYHALTVGLSSH